MNRKSDYYSILGVLPSADADVIRAAYRALAKKYHPDTGRDAASDSRLFIEITEAYEVLSDPIRREQYDRELGSGSEQEQPWAHYEDTYNEADNDKEDQPQAADQQHEDGDWPHEEVPEQGRADFLTPPAASRKGARAWFVPSLSIIAIALAIYVYGRPLISSGSIATAQRTIVGLLVPSEKGPLPPAFFDKKAKLTIQSAASKMITTLRKGGTIGVNIEVDECYKAANDDTLLYCLAFDSTAEIVLPSIERMNRFPVTPQYESEAYETRTRTNLSKHGIADAVQQSRVISELRDASLAFIPSAVAQRP